VPRPVCGPRWGRPPAPPILFLGFVDTEPLPQGAWAQILGRLTPGQAPALVEHGGGPGDLAGRAAHIHAGVVQDEILERAQAPGEPDQRLGFKGVAALANPLGQKGLGAEQTLVEAGERDRRGLGGCGAVRSQGLALSAGEVVAI
jgi:hypothetical protein